MVSTYLLEVLKIPKKFSPAFHSESELRKKIHKLDAKSLARLHRQTMREKKLHPDNEDLQVLENIVSAGQKKHESKQKHALSSSFIRMQTEKQSV